MKIYFHEKIALGNGILGMIFVVIWAAGIGVILGVVAGTIAAAILLLLAERLKLQVDDKGVLVCATIIGVSLLGALAFGFLCAKRLCMLRKNSD